MFFLEQFMTTIVLVDSSLTLFVGVSPVSKTLGGKGGRADDYKGDDLPMYQILILSFFLFDDDDYEGDPEEAAEDASPLLGDEAGSLCQTRLE